MKKQHLIIMLLLFTVFVGFGIIIPIMPEIIESSGDPSLHLALLLSLYSAASFFMSPLWGKWSDRIGRRPIILTGLLGFSVSFFLFGIADGNMVLMYASRIIGGLFSGAVTACAVAYVADITTDEERTKGMGLVGMSIGMGFVFGPAIGGLLSKVNYSLPFFVSAGLSLVALLFTSVALPESLSAEKRGERKAQKASRWTAFAGSMKYLYVLSFLVSFTLAGLETVFQLFQIKKIGVTSFQIGMMFLLSGVVGAVIQGGVVRKRIKKGGEMKAIGIGLVISAIGFILMLFSSNAITAAIYMSIFGAGNALIRPCVTSLITQKTTVGQGVATGLNSSMDSLGRILGPLLGMAAYNLYMGLPFITGAIVCLAAIWLLVGFNKGERHNAKLNATAS